MATTKTAGVDVLLYIKSGVDVTPETIVGGQSGATLNRSMDTIETTSKDSGGWQEFIGSLKSWSMDCEGFYVASDAAYTSLETAWLNKTAVEVEIRVGIKTFTGSALITDFPMEFPQDDAVTIKLTLQGTGALVVA